MLLRSLQAVDIEPLAQLMATTPLWQRYNVTETSAAQRLRNGFEQQATILVAEIDGAPVGFIWYVLKGAFNRSGYVMLIGVRADQRSQGVGQALMQAAEAAVFAEVNDLFLLVSDFNQAAQAFYQRLGYQQVGAIPDYVMPGITELIFHKRKP
ncbi:MAG: GNAT family N-acetyltransferase [Caldilineaceae bacterium]